MVSRAIFRELVRTGSEHVWLDATKISDWTRFPQVFQLCRQHGIDPRREWIPVVPVAHYHCGGIRTDRWGETTCPGLFAVGECACTGLHGANRLASNSLLELMVMGRRCAQRIHAMLHALPEVQAVAIQELSQKMERVSEDWGRYAERVNRFRMYFQRYAGIIRTRSGLHWLRAWLCTEERALPGWQEVCSGEGVPWRTLQEFNWHVRVSVGKAIVEWSLARRENAGCFYLEENAGRFQEKFPEPFGEMRDTGLYT